MPDPLLYTYTLIITILTSASTMLALRRLWPRGRAWFERASLCGLATGLVTGYELLRARPAWPPTTALDRLLILLFPATLTIEFLATIPAFNRRVIQALRFSIAIVAGRVLLHRSVYLDGSFREWSESQALLTLSMSAFALVSLWILFSRFATSLTEPSLSLSLAATIQASGVAIMLGGYIKGGAAAIPLVSAILGVTLAGFVRIGTAEQEDSRNFTKPSVLGIGLIGLFGLIFTGLFFGRLNSLHALILLASPLLCLGPDLFQLRFRSGWTSTISRVGLVLVPLFCVLFLAKRHFDHHMAPFL